MHGYNDEMHRDVRLDAFPWWRSRFEGVWALLFLAAIGLTSFATIVLFNAVPPTSLGGTF